MGKKELLKQLIAGFQALLPIESTLVNLLCRLIAGRL